MDLDAKAAMIVARIEEIQAENALLDETEELEVEESQDLVDELQHAMVGEDDEA